MSLEDILSRKPSLLELCEHVNISTKWYTFGVLLNLDTTKLDGIRMMNEDISFKAIKMFELWLSSNPNATRNQVINTLRKKTIGEISVAKNYMLTLREHSTVPENEFEAGVIVHIYLSPQSLVRPIKVAQLLFSERCVSEQNLDSIEIPEGSLDVKQTILFSAICTAVSSDYQNLKVLGNTLSNIEETRTIASSILHEYAQKFPNMHLCEARADQTDTVNNEDCASNILRNHYGMLSQFLRDPIDVTRMLHEEGVFSETLLVSMNMESPRLSLLLKRTVLLRAVRGAVHSSSQNLKVFASVLLKFIDNVPLANAILKDYNETFYKSDTQKESYSIDDFNETSPDSAVLPIPNTSLSQIDTPSSILIPRSMGRTFNEIRGKFGSTFFKVRQAISNNPPPVEEVKILLQDSFIDLKPQIAHVNTINEILNVVRDKCTLTDISYLETIVEEFDVKEAKVHIQTYKMSIEEFCATVSVRLCLNQNFRMSSSSSSLKCETAIFVLDWNPDNCVVNDIKDVLSECFERLSGTVQIEVIKKTNSITVTCVFPLSLATSLIAKAQETIESVKKRELMKLTIGQCIIFDKHIRDKEIKVLETAIEEKLYNKMTLEIEELKCNVKQHEETVQQMIEDKQNINDNLQAKLDEQTITINEKTAEIEDLKYILRQYEDEEILELDENQEADQLSYNDTWRVKWEDKSVTFTSPEIKQCEHVMDELKRLHEEKWRIWLKDSHSDSLLVVLQNINECLVTELEISHTSLDSFCVDELSHVLMYNKTIEILVLSYSPLTDNGLEPLCNGVSVNTTLKKLELFHDNTITDQDIHHISKLLLVNKTLQILDLYCLKVTAWGRGYLSDAVAKNKTLRYLQINGYVLLFI